MSLFSKRWSPYVVGVGIGVLSWITFISVDKALGTSTSMVHAAGAITAIAAPERLKTNPYYAKEITPKAPLFDWQMFLVISLPLGAALAAWMARDFNREHVPSLWRWRFGESRFKRYIWAFIGGVILIYGARMAGGCTSGHGISGGLQLALSSWTFFIAMFLSGVITAFALFGKEGRSHV
jgi:uncharacterized protein